MFETVVIIGIACVIAAVVGGGLSLAGTSIPKFDSTRRQVALGITGALIIGLAVVFFKPPDPNPNPGPAAAPPATTVTKMDDVAVRVVDPDGHGIAPNGNGVIATIPSGQQPDRSVELKCQLSGDFSVKVHYALTQWPKASGARVGIIAGGFGIERLSDDEGNANGEKFAFATPYHTVVFTPASDVGGTLQIDRHGSAYVATVQPDGESQVQTIGFGTGRTDDAGVSISLWSGAGRDAGDRAVGFEDLQVTPRRHC